MNGLIEQWGYSSATEVNIIAGYTDTSTFTCISQFRNVDRGHPHNDGEIWRISSTTKLIKNVTFPVGYLCIGF